MRILILATISLVFMLLAAASTFACACCVNRGYYEHSRIKTNSFYTAMLSDIKLKGPAELYLTEGGFDVIKGLPEVARDESEGKEIRFEVSSSFDRRTWRIAIKDAGGRTGSLILPLPAFFTKHAVDVDGADTGLGVSLYKEFTVAGRAANATGIFRSARSAAYQLVFQGRGNGCDDSSDFTRWRLELNGPRADYAFFGNVAQ